jgi:hypothetical protein
VNYTTKALIPPCGVLEKSSKEYYYALFASY